MTRRELSESRAPVGSSASTIAGSATSARAIAPRCCSPPDSSSGRCPARGVSPTVSNAARAAASERASATPSSTSGSETFSTSESSGRRLYRWKTNPIRRRRTRANASSSSDARSTPSKNTLPAVGREIPPSRWSSVLLPEPEAPVIATNSPCSMERSTPSRAATLAAPAPLPPNVFCRCSARRIDKDKPTPKASVTGLPRLMYPFLRGVRKLAGNYG